MAYSSSTLLLALMLVATASVVHCSVALHGKTVDIITVNGTVNCKYTGKGAAGVSVSPSLDGGNTTVAAGVTDDCGEITIDVPVNAEIDVDIDISDITITANVTAGTCYSSSPAKVVKSPVTLVDITVTDGGLVDANLGIEIDV